ncbi:MAG: hypothetical protein V4525_10930 [Pseudomonadota bacterium]
MTTDQTIIGKNADGTSIRVCDLPASYTNKGPFSQVDTVTYGPDESGNYYPIKLGYKGGKLAESQSSAPKIAQHLKEHLALGIEKKLPTTRFTGYKICDWQNNGTLALSAGVGASAALDPTVQLFGKPTLKCVFSSAASDTFVATYTLANSIRLRNIKNIQIPLLFTNNASGNGNIGSVTTPFQVWLHTSLGHDIRCQIIFDNLQPGVFTTLSLARASASITSTAVSELDSAGVTVTSVKVVQGTNNASANSYPVWLGEIRADAKLNKGYVTIINDGVYSSQYDILFPMMQKYGIKSSLAIPALDIGTAGRMSLAQINEMNKAGHKPISHTNNSIKTGGYGNATDWPTGADITDDVRAQWDLFDTQGWETGYGVWGFSYGFASALSLARQQLVASALKAGGMQFMRKSVPYNGETGATALIPLCDMPLDPLVLSGALQITNTHTPADFYACVDQAEATGMWSIITVHRAVASSPGALEMTSANFDLCYKYLADRVSEGGVINESFSDVCKTLKCESGIWHG